MKRLIIMFALVNVLWAQNKEINLGVGNKSLVTNSQPVFNSIENPVDTTSEDTVTDISFLRLLNKSVIEDTGSVDAFKITDLLSGTINGSSSLQDSMLWRDSFVSWKPDTNAFGDSLAAFNIVAVDTVMGAEDTTYYSQVPQTVKVKVDPVNDPPSFKLAFKNYSIPEDHSQEIDSLATNIDAGAANENDQNLRFVLTPDNPELFSEVPAIDSSNGTLSVKLAPDAFGATIIDISLNDGVDSFKTAFTLNVLPVNDPPVFTSLDTLQATEETFQPVSYFELLDKSNAQDSVDNGQIKAFKVKKLLSGELKIGENVISESDSIIIRKQSASWKSAPGIFGKGIKAFTVVAVDDSNSQSQRPIVVLFNVNELPFPKITHADTVRVNEDNDIKIPIHAYNPDLKPLFFKIDSSGTIGHFTSIDSIYQDYTTTITVAYSPLENFNGKDSFYIEFKGSQGLKADTDVIINIKPVNDPPESRYARIDTLIRTGAEVEINLNQLFTDVDNDSLRYNIDNGSKVKHSTNNSGTAIFTVPEDSLGIEEILIKASDPYGASDSLKINFDIKPQAQITTRFNPDPPVFGQPVTITAQTESNGPLTVINLQAKIDGGMVPFSKVNEQWQLEYGFVTEKFGVGYIVEDTFGEYQTETQYTNVLMPSGSKSEQIDLGHWQMFSVPFNIMDSTERSLQYVLDELGPEKKNNDEQWKIARINPNNLFDGSDYVIGTTFLDALGVYGKFNSGNAFWIYLRDVPDRLINFPQMYALKADSDFVYKLQPGWNQVGNPFPFQLDLKNNLASEKSESLQFYSYNPDAEDKFEIIPHGSTFTIQPFGGFAVLNNDSLNSVNLRFKPLGQQPQKKAAQKQYILNDEMRITSGTHTCVLRFGMSADSRDNWDLSDFAYPPEISQKPFRAWFKRKWKNCKSHNFVTDFRQAKSGEQWLFTITGTTQATLTIRPKSLSQNFESRVVYDRKLLKRFDIEPKKIIRLTNICPADENRFVYIVGDESYINQAISGMEKFIPGSFELSQNYPNPFNPVTHFKISVPERSKIKVEIFNVLGQRVKVLTDKEFDAGTYTLIWTGKNDLQQSLASGIYYYRMQAKGFVLTRKMVKIK